MAELPALGTPVPHPNRLFIILFDAFASGGSKPVLVDFIASNLDTSIIVIELPNMVLCLALLVTVVLGTAVVG